MGSDRTWFVCFESACARSLRAEVITEALTSIPLAKVEQRGEELWQIRVGKASFDVGLSRETWVLAESAEMAESATDPTLASVLERADARFEIAFDVTDLEWIGAALEHAAVRLATLTEGVAHDADERFFGSISTETTELEGDRRDAVAAALAARFPATDEDDLMIERVVQPFFGRWTILDVTCTSGPHPERVHLACDDAALDEERIVVLTGRRESIGELKASERAACLVVPSAVQSYVLNLSFWTSPPGPPPRIVTSIDDVPFEANLDAAETAVADAFRRDHGASIRAVTAERSGDGWAVGYWFVEDDRVIRRDVSVSSAGDLVERDTVVASELPINARSFGGVEIF